MNSDSTPVQDPFDYDPAAPDHSSHLAHLMAPGHLDHAHSGADYDSLAFLNDHLPGSGLPGAGLEPAHAHALGSQLIGDGDSNGVWHQQQTPFTCAVVSQEMILKEFGMNVNEAQLMGEAMQHGWLTDAGTPFADVGKLLELHGVPCHEGQGIDQMVQDLSRGHKVIVGVDSGDLWNGDSWIARELHDMTSGGPQADHAIVVQGLRQDDDGSWHVIVNDSGNPNGEGHDYPLDQFTHAWDGFQCRFVATDIAPDGLSSHPVFGSGFDEQSGTYNGVLDWLNAHGALVRTVALGAVLLARPLGSSGKEQSDTDRNDTLRRL